MDETEEGPKHPPVLDFSPALPCTTCGEPATVGDLLYDEKYNCWQVWPRCLEHMRVYVERYGHSQKEE